MKSVSFLSAVIHPDHLHSLPNGVAERWMGFIFEDLPNGPVSPFQVQLTLEQSAPRMWGSVMLEVYSH